MPTEKRTPGGHIQRRCRSYRGVEKKNITDLEEVWKNEKFVSREDRHYTKCHILRRHANSHPLFLPHLDPADTALVRRHKFLLSF